MALTGTLVNGLMIIIGTAIGLFLQKIDEKYKETALNAVGLAVILIGLQMAFEVNQLIVVILSLMFGGILGEALKLEERLNQIGDKVGTIISKKSVDQRISQGFITASLIFVIGAMGIVGALDSGLRYDHSILYTKSILDGFTSMILTTTLGVGVGLSVFPVVIYQGSLALLAVFIYRYVPEAFLDLWIIDVTATGGLMITAIGLNMLGITKIRIANLIPALVIVTGLLAITHVFF
ncbi:membrane protein [Halolactibacillus alkaliphilus]|uniref:Membrane protein n=1 Tax=Halolactibacillus alkaliphilus TaxID=442899 RepID=A0A511X0E5_9BACI|nr:DUF554 domain-containing protein [Halolactibacillus alkaliphilus]GEN56422.1 membrane protein [Halolactibacillus alkaliphilus]GGN64529.1 membrane protein [Halolactibacillus alkaliphilus]SFO60946.1 hypothetical protein SAMN05720591_10125 [Halolactibacillus alkaliphilus]